MLKSRINTDSIIVKLIMLTLASAMMAFNLKAFISNGGLVPGGLSGLAVLIQRIFESYCGGIHIPYSAIYLPLNSLCFYIGFRYIGKKFTLYSLYVIVLSSILTDIMPVVPITYDVLLISIFGAIINGVAITLCLQSGACSGGTDFISIFMSERKGIDAWNYIFAGNVAMLVIAGILFGFDKALYSIIYQFTQTQILNTLNKRYQKHTMWIVTSKRDEVSDAICNATNHGGTFLRGTGYHDRTDKDIIYSVVGSEDIAPLIVAIKEIDPDAFINIQKTDLVVGNFYQRPTE